VSSEEDRFRRGHRAHGGRHVRLRGQSGRRLHAADVQPERHRRPGVPVVFAGALRRHPTWRHRRGQIAPEPQRGDHQARDRRRRRRDDVEDEGRLNRRSNGRAQRALLDRRRSQGPYVRLDQFRSDFQRSRGRQSAGDYMAAQQMAANTARSSGLRFDEYDTW